MNNKGFTLVELLGSMVILGLLMALVIPNIVGLLNNSKEVTYVEDAKKMINIAQNKVTMKKFALPTADNECVFLGLGYLDNSEFQNPPYSGCYDVNRSFVVIKRESNEYKYYAQLVEYHDNGKFTGITTPIRSDLLNKDNVEEKGANEMTHFDYTSNSAGIVLGCKNPYKAILTKSGTRVYTQAIGICSK